jgi:hypothetical protein
MLMGLGVDFPTHYMYISHVEDIQVIAFILATTIQYDFIQTPVPESVARQCAADVGIPYASDAFSDAEWQKFKQCIRHKVK